MKLISVSTIPGLAKLLTIGLFIFKIRFDMVLFKRLPQKNPRDDHGEDLVKIHSKERDSGWQLLVSTRQIKKDVFANFKDLFLLLLLMRLHNPKH